MLNKTARKTINIDKPNLIPLWTFKESDNVILNLALFKDAVAFNITAQAIKLGAKTPKGLKEQIDGFTINGNELDIELKNTILVPGIVEIDLEFTDAEGKMTSASFFINVDSKVLNDKAVEATNEFSTFKKTVDEINVDYKGLRTIMLDENNAANLQDQVNQTNEQLADIVHLINSSNITTEYTNTQVKIVKGIYDTITIKDNVICDFNNAIFKKITIQGSNIKIKNCNIINNSDFVIEILSGENIEVDNMRISNSTNGITIKNANNVNIKNIKIENTFASPLTIWNSTNIYIDNIKSNNSVWGVNIQTGAKNIFIKNSDFILSYVDDTQLVKIAEHGVYAHHFENIVFDNCLFKGWDRVGACGIKLRDGKKALFKNCIIENCNNDIGLYIQEDINLLDIEINKCEFVKSTTHYIYVRHYTGVNTIINSIFKGCIFNNDVNINNYSGTGYLTFDEGNIFKGMVICSGTATREMDIINSCFENSLNNGYMNCILINGVNTYKVDLIGNTFLNWGNGIGEDLMWDYKELYKGAIGIRNSRDIRVLNNRMLENSKRTISVMGSSATYVNLITVGGNTGGNEIYGFMSGTKLKNYVYSNTIYNGVATPAFYNSANNNVSIKDDNTIIVF